MLTTEIEEVLKKIKNLGLYPEVKMIQGVSSNPEVEIDGKKYINFASANYLGLANDERVKEAVIQGIKDYGLHPTGARLVSGTLDIHKKLEQETARFKNTEDAMIFQTGVLANIGTIPAVINLPVISASSAVKSFLKINKAAIFSDELNHASIIDGCRLAKAERIVYKHCDVRDLENKLKKSKASRKLIVTDGVFSMDGDIAPMPEIIELAKKYKAMTMVDDAHATGVLGKKGGGTLEYFGINGGVDIYMGTYSKAFGLVGGFVAGKKELIDYLRVTARTYIFSGATFGSIAAGILKSLEIIENDDERRKKVIQNADYLREELQKIGLNTLESKDTPIIPILVGPEDKAIKIYDELFSHGILAPSIRWPAVGMGNSRIRISVTSGHEKEQLDKLVGVFERLGDKYNIVKK